MKNKYLAKFDANGIRQTSVVEGVHFNTAAQKQKYLDDGFIEITDMDQELLATNDYYRKSDGTLAKIDRTPSPEQVKEHQLSALDAQYEADKAMLTTYYMDAVMADDTALQAELKAELIDLNTNYDKEREAIENGN